MIPICIGFAPLKEVTPWSIVQSQVLILLWNDCGAPSARVETLGKATLRSSKSAKFVNSDRCEVSRSQLLTRHARPYKPSVGMAEHSVTHRLVAQVSKPQCSFCRHYHRSLIPQITML